jgi:MoaE-MoaD fusion protein
MVRVKLLFFGILKDIIGAAEAEAEYAGPRTAGDILESYCARYETLRDKRPSILIARNREFTTADTLVGDGDEIAFLPPVSGGSDQTSAEAGADIFQIIREPIDAKALARELLRPEDGAVVTFEGVVRNNTRGRATLHLEYECYEPMALAQMRRIGREIADAHGIGRIGIVHRLGRLEIGEASVVIVATSPHRKQAFAAALEAIDRLKREVPIWKKEFFEDGAVWVDGEWDEDLLASSKLGR